MIIVGLHGAGFTNLVFCKPGTTVIEIFGADFIVTDYWSLANQFDLNYYAYCDDQFYKNITNYTAARREPTVIDVDNFMRIIEKEKIV